MQRMRGFRDGDLAEFSLRRVEQLEKRGRLKYQSITET